MALKIKKGCNPVRFTTINGDESVKCSGEYMIVEDFFKNNTLLKEVEIPNETKEIRKGAFEGCTSLTTVKLPESIDIIRPTAFKGCTALETIVLPNSIKRIECWIDRRIASVTLYRPFTHQSLRQRAAGQRRAEENRILIKDVDGKRWWMR